MSSEPLKVGDAVRVSMMTAQGVELPPTKRGLFLQNGLVAVVGRNVGVAFLGEDYHLHDLDGACAPHHGFWFYASELERLGTNNLPPPDLTRPDKMIGKNGLAVPVNDWQLKVDYACDPEGFSCIVTPTHELLNKLTPAETARLFAKLRLVARASKLMAAGMLKGVLKYNTDDYPLKTWIAHLLDEGADQMNYQMLLVDALEHWGFRS